MKNVEQMMIGNTNGHSVTFKKFIKDVADSKTKYEESLVMQTEIESLKKEIKTPYGTPGVQHERLVKLIYIHMLGYDATFGVIDAIKFAQQSSLFYKRLGYLVSSLLLHPGRSEALLLCCSLQKDLASESVVEQSMALTSICQLMGKDTITAFLPTILRKLSHPKEIIRKKAVDVMYQFLCELPSQSHDEKYQAALCDPDAGVMISALPIYLKLCKEQPQHYKAMCGAFTDILIQIVEGRLHNSFNYHTFPAPWAQIYLLQILQHLGAVDKQLSSAMSRALHLVLARASAKLTTPQAADAATAVLCQACRTVLCVYPDQDLLLLVTRKIEELLHGGSSKVFMGLTLLENLCERQPTIGAPFIPQVYQYLSHNCSMIKEATVRVLKVGITADNLDDASQALLQLLAGENRPALQTLCCEVLEGLGKQHAPSPASYVDLLLKTLALTSPSTPHPTGILSTLINFCTSNHDEEVRALLRGAAQDDSGVQISWLNIWALGRYDPDFERALLWVEKIESLSESQLQWLLDSLVVLVTRLGPLPAKIYSLLHPYLHHPDPVLRQLAVELFNLSNTPHVTSYFRQGEDALSQLIDKLAATSATVEIEHTAAHKQFLNKFRKRVHCPAEKVSFEHDDIHEQGPKQRAQEVNKDGTPTTAHTWVSYHEHIPEEGGVNEKPEPPLPQPALRHSYRWGQPPNMPLQPPKPAHSDPTRC